MTLSTFSSSFTYFLMDLIFFASDRMCLPPKSSGRVKIVSFTFFGARDLAIARDNASWSFFLSACFDAFSQLACLRQEVSQDSRVADVEHEVLDPRFPERLDAQGYYFRIGFRRWRAHELASDLEYFPLLSAPLFFKPYDPAVIAEPERRGMVLHLSGDYPAYLRRNVGPQAPRLLP